MSSRLIQVRLLEGTIHRVEDIAVALDAENHTEALVTSVAAFHPITKCLQKGEIKKITLKTPDEASIIRGTLFVVPSDKAAKRVEVIIKIAMFLRII